MKKSLIKARSLKEMKAKWADECRQHYGPSWSKRNASRKFQGASRLNVY